MVAETINRKKLFTGIGAFVFVVAFGALLVQTGLISTSSILPSAEERKTVASVNGTDITEAELNKEIAALAKSFGVAPESEQYAAMAQNLRDSALDNLIVTKLLLEQAAQKGISISKAELAQNITTIKEQLGGDAGFQDQLAAVGMSEADLLDAMGKDMLIRALLAQEVDTTVATSTDEALRALYDEQYANAENPPAYADVEASLREALAGKAVQERYAAYIEQLKAGATIEKK